ncbi:MAG TPA: GGDEF domain-containing protein [Jatrophihabitans sp.]|nr:GGDEF domain-containing protein [Jatrophihabitans sp.]
MSVFRKGTFSASVVLALLLIVATGLYLRHAQDSARQKLRDDFAGRAALAAKLTSGAFSSRSNENEAYAKSTYSGPADTIQTATRVDHATDGDFGRVAVLSADDGKVLGSSPPLSAAERAAIISQPEIVAARHGRLSLSGVVSTRGRPAVMLAVPFQTHYGLRIWWTSVPLSVMSDFAHEYFASAVGVAGGSAVLIDLHDVVIAATPGETQGHKLRSGALAAALTQHATGVLGDRDYVSAAIPGLPWRLVLTAPTDALLAPQASAHRLTWQVFGAFALAIFGILGFAARALKNSERLAHERLHDALTGLPNRTLFLHHTQQALNAARARGGHLAALFIDLDRFKPINDEFGHATGDAVLRVVAQRLADSTRAGDVISRFGGDEFNVLCVGLSDRQQGLEIAERNQQALALSFEINDYELSIGSSIGIAFYSPVGPVLDAESLIQYADLAMYEAKRNGRARIETIEPRPATPAL